jgi:hypothetical protein
VTAEIIIESLERFVIASEAKQSSASRKTLDCFVASLLAMTDLESCGREQHL